MLLIQRLEALKQRLEDGEVVELADMIRAALG